MTLLRANISRLMTKPPAKKKTPKVKIQKKRRPKSTR